MTVVTGWFVGQRTAGLPDPAALPAHVVHALKVNIAMTSKVRPLKPDGCSASLRRDGERGVGSLGQDLLRSACCKPGRACCLSVCVPDQAFLTTDEQTGKTVFVGNRTECALLLMLQQWGIDYQAVRDKEKAHLHQVRG